MRSAMSNDRRKLTEMAWQKVKSLNIPQEDLAILMGKYSLYKKDYDEAETIFTTILKEIPEESEAIEGLGMIALARKNYLKADTFFKEALIYEKDSVWYLTLRGEIAEVRKRPHLAIELYERAKRLTSAGNREIQDPWQNVQPGREQSKSL